MQEHLNKVQHWLRRWRIKANDPESVQVTFTLRRDSFPPVKLNDKQILQAESARYLGLHLDRRLNWKTYIWQKRKQLWPQLKKMYWLIGPNSKLSLENKVLLYKCVLKPVCSYGMQLWGTAARSNIKILERFQAKVLRILVSAPWFATNNIIRKDLKIEYVKGDIKNNSEKYIDRLSSHPNQLATTWSVKKQKHVG